MGIYREADGAAELDLGADVVSLAQTLCDIPSVSGAEAAIADAVELALRQQCQHLEVMRNGNAVVARSNFGLNRRVVVAGHLDTVPVSENFPSKIIGTGVDRALWGRGSVDMKGGVAVQLRLARSVMSPMCDVTYVFYDQEETAAPMNGLGRLARTNASWISGDFAVLCEPTAGEVEVGCQGSLQLEVEQVGVAAHSARPWTGRNAIHDAVDILATLRSYEPRRPLIDGLSFRESLSAVGIRGGVAMNVIPSSCTVRVNYRFAPDRTIDEAEKHMREVFTGFSMRFIDALPAAPPNLQDPFVENFCFSVARHVAAKLGWTDVARFAKLGIPAVNFGPGDPQLAHTGSEQCPIASIERCEADLGRWLRGS